MISRTQKEYTADDIAQVATTYHKWKHDEPAFREGLTNIGATLPIIEPGDLYEDQPGYCKSATLKDIAANDYVLTPGRYVGAAPIEDDGIPFETKMAEYSSTLFEQMREAEKQDGVIRKNLGVLGYGE